ncbi:MAG: two-component regulator propeller domain-containing protein [Bacteroidales bacterium]|nr:two-component regulator propeller domain-containing protein [Bacteroidales bacterium]
MKRGFNFHSEPFLWISISIVLFFFQINLVAQSNLRFEHINKNNGLSQGTVNAILQDNNGLMWFGTNDGLNRYDGKNMIIYRRNHADKNSLPNNNILSLGQDYKNRIWIGTMGSGLFYLDPVRNTFHSFRELIDNSDKLDIGQRINCIFIDPTDNVLWAGSNTGVISLDFNSRKLTFIDFSAKEIDGIFVGNIYSLLVEKNLVWIGTDKGGLLRLDINTNQLISIPNINQKNFINDIGYRDIIMNILRDKNGLLWVSTLGSGVLLFDEKELALVDPDFAKENKNDVFSPWIRSMALVGDTAIWCITSGEGLQIINLKTKKITLSKSNPTNSFGLTSNALKSIYSDNIGGIWVGDNGHGINYYFPVSKKIRPISYSTGASSLTFQSVRSIYRDENKNLWIGGYGGFNIFDNHFNRIIVSENIENAYCIYADQNDKEIVWIGSEGDGLRKVSKINGRLLKWYEGKASEKDEGLMGSSVYSILAKSDDEIWVGTEQALNVFNKKTGVNFEMKIESNEKLFDTKGRVRVIYKDSKKRTWIGTLGEGLTYMYNNTLVFNIFKNDAENSSSISSNIIYSVFESKGGVIYIGTDNGLNVYDEVTATFKHITTANGLINDVVYGILEDEENNIWLSTNEGISCYNPSNGSFRNYDAEDGFQANEFNSGAYYKDDEGTLYFGGVNGVSIFRPKDLFDNPFEPKIVFTQLKIGNSPAVIDPPITTAKEIKLDYFNQSFRLEFAALNYYKPKKNQYAYRIKEIRNEWTYLGNENSIEIANLGYGTFTIEVIASNNDGVWNERGISLNIIIDPPFWATHWFRISVIVFLFILLSIFFFLRISVLKRNKRLLQEEVEIRTSELRKANLELLHEIKVRKKTEDELILSNQTKDKFFSIIAHDLKNPFNVMLGLTDILSEDFETFEPHEQKELLQTVSKSAKELYNLLENLLSWSLTQQGKLVYTFEKFDLCTIVHESVILLTPHANQKNIELKTDICLESMVLADKNSINTVIRNLISNAIKFTPSNGKVTISSEENNGMITVSVNDTGVGISEANLSKLFRVDEQFKTIGTAKEKGTGLGLVLCSEFIHANGGTINVKSTLGKGSTFSFSLPKAN